MSAGCDNLGEPTKKERDESVANVLKAMGSKSCSTSSDIDQFSLAMGGYVSSPIVDAGVNLNTSYASSLTGTDGCEQIAIASDQFASSVKKISCLITSDSSNVNVKTINTNTIEFDAGRDLKADSIKLVQKIGVKVVTLANLSNNTKQQIADEVQNAALKTIEVAQDSKSGMGATPQGSKVVTDSKSEISQENLTKIVNETIKDVDVTTTSQNVIKIYSKRDIILEKPFEATQEIVADIAATIILSNSITGALESFTKNISETRAEIKQKAENLGADTLGRQAAEGYAAMVQAQKSGIGGYGGIATVVFLIIALFAMNKMFGAGGGGGYGMAGGGAMYAQSMGWSKKLLIIFFILCAIASGVAVWWTNFGGAWNYWSAKKNKRDEELKKCLYSDPPIAEKDCVFTVELEDYSKFNPPIYGILAWIGVSVFLLGAFGVFLYARIQMRPPIYANVSGLPSYASVAIPTPPPAPPLPKRTADRQFAQEFKNIQGMGTVQKYVNLLQGKPIPANTNKKSK
jgi:hypothetical protein